MEFRRLFIPGKEASGTHRILGWVDFGDDLGAVVKKKTCLYRNLNLLLNYYQNTSMTAISRLKRDC
jgi:hypothetical protein